jgi:serine/threonine-protein kinase
MSDDDRNRREDSNAPGGSSARRFTSGSTVPRDSNRPAAVSTDAYLEDQTVISTSPPLALQPAGRMHPRELGRALEGRQLDHVLLEQFVGGGGMGAVFRAWDTELHRTVAVKVLSTHQTSDEESQRRFQTEARSAARLDHPNIARVYYVGEDEGVRYIVFEYIDGANLRDIIHANGPLPLADAVNYALQIAGALAHAWEREVVHRDIKPSNILITQDGLAKLVDMGLARLEQIDGSVHDETATGVTLGTFDYISPEQARNPRDADTRSDIYSLGCTLFFILTGRPPFPEGTVLQKLLQHQGEPAPDVRQFRPDVPDALAAVLARMLAKRPDDRFATPSDLSAALASCGEQMGLAPGQVSLPAYWPKATATPQPLRQHAAWLVPTVLLVLGVLWLAIVWNRAVPPQEFPKLQIQPVTAMPVSEPMGGNSDPAGVEPNAETGP